MKTLLILISCSGVLSASYWSTFSSDQKRIQEIDQVIRDAPKIDHQAKNKNMFEKQS